MTIQNNQILRGTITHKIRDYTQGAFTLKKDVVVNEGDEIEFVGACTTSGYQYNGFVFQGLVNDVDYLENQKITAISFGEEIDNSPTATYYGRQGGLIHDLLDNELSEIIHNFSQTSPYLYRARWNFRNDTASGIADGWDNWCGGGGPYHAYVKPVKTDHKKVMELYDNNAAGWGAARRYWSGDEVKEGAAEFYIMFSNNNTNHEVRYENFYHNPTYDGCRLRWANDGKVYYTDSGGSYVDSGETYSANTWYKVKIILYADTNKWEFWIDDSQIASNLDCKGNITSYPVDGLHITTDTSAAGGYIWFDAVGFEAEEDYEAGLNAKKEYDNLDYSGEWQTWVLKGDKSIRSFFDIYADSYLKTWYLNPNNRIFINDGDVDSGFDILPNSKVWSIKGKKLIKNIDIVILKGGYSGSARLYSISGTGSVIYRDTYAHIKDQDTLDAIADNLLTNKSANPITIRMYLKDEEAGFIQPGETISIPSGIRFSKSTKEIPAGQYIIRQIKYYIKNGQYEKVDLTLDDGLVFEREIDDALPQENSDLITQVGIAATEGEANTGANVGTDGVGVYDGKSGSTLNFRHIAPGNSKITTTLNGNDIDIAVTGVLSNLVEDTSPQLGGNLDLVDKTITCTEGDRTFYFGRARMGGVATDYAYWSHWDQSAYPALKQHGAGGVVMDSALGISFNIQGTPEAIINTAGLQLKSGASVNELSTDGTLADNSDDALPTEKAVKTYVDGQCELSNDTTPQLGGSLDLNSKGITEELIAGESLVNGNLCYINGSGYMNKSDASIESTCDTLLAMCTESISAYATGTFLLFGKYGTSGLTPGSEYFASETAGAITTTRPTNSGTIIRHVGTALTSNILFFNPSHSYVEHA